MMNASASFDQGMRFVGSAYSGHSVMMDASTAVGGDDNGFRPMELVLTALCGCTAMDTLSILRKKKQQVTDLKVTARADRSAAHPKIFTHIVLEYAVIGIGVQADAVERAITLSAEQYCPIQAMLGQSATFSYTYRIAEQGAASQKSTAAAAVTEKTAGYEGKN